MLSSFHSAAGDDVLDAPISPESASDPLQGCAVGRKDHGLTVGVKFNYVMS